MIDQQANIDTACEEVVLKRWGTTEQLLDVHEVVYEDGKPKAVRVDIDKGDGSAVVYFPIKEEKFHLAVYVDTNPVTLKWVDTEAANSVCFKAISKTLSLEKLSSLTNLKPTTGWTMGGKRHYKSDLPASNSCVIFEPNPEPDEFKDKIGKLLTYLESDKEGVAAIIEKAGGYIQVASVFHNGNTCLGGLHLDKDIIRRASLLNLEIDFDLYAEGNFFRE